MIMEVVRDAAAAAAGGSAAEVADDDVSEAAERIVYGDLELREAADGIAQDGIAQDALGGGFAGGGAGGWQYMVVLTKVDKGGQKAARRAEAMVRVALGETGCPRPHGIVVTSASKKVGRAEMWRMLRGMVLRSDEEDHEDEYDEYE